MKNDPTLSDDQKAFLDKIIASSSEITQKDSELKGLFDNIKKYINDMPDPSVSLG